MEPALIGTRLASAAIGPLLKKLLVSESPGAGLIERSDAVRLSSLVSFRGEHRTLTEKDVRRLAGTLVERSLDGDGERPFPADEAEAVTDALAATLLALGDLDMDDVQAVRLGHTALARRLRAAAPAADGLSTDSVHYLETLVEWACLHVLEFFTRRSTFVARSLVEQTRGQSELIAKVDELVRRTPRADTRDADFERRYLEHLARKHGRLTIYGIDLHHSPDEWPLDMAYLSLEATGRETARSDGNGQGAAPGHGVPADRALHRHPRILLRGVAGSGKTTLVQWLAITSTGAPGSTGRTTSAGSTGRTGPTGQAAQTGPAGRERQAGQTGQAGPPGTTGAAIPFVLPLRTLTRHDGPLPPADRFLSAVGCPLTPPDGWADRVLRAGRGLVLVDGIDEVPEPERARTRRWLRDLVDAYDGPNRWLVTSRPSAVKDDWLTADGFTELTLSEMSRAEVTTFVRRWHTAAGPDAGPYEQPLVDALHATPDLAKLATNPLMCGLICALHRDRRGFLPRGRKALYDAALSMLLTRRDRERDMGAPYGVELGEAPQIQLIQRLAYWLTLNGRTQMDRDHARTIVAEAVPAVPEAAAHGDPHRVFDHLLHRSGLLREPTPGTLDFIHRTFQDYLAAKHLVDRWDIGVLIGHAADDQWEDVVRMAVGHSRPRECAEILRELLAAADRAEEPGARLRLLVVAATALDHATEVAPEIREELLDRTARVIPPRTPDEARSLATVGPTVLGLLPSPAGLDDEQALMSVITASRIPGDAAIPYLARFTGHPSLSVRSQLVWAWPRFETRAYAERIVARLDPAGLDFTVRGDEHAAELERLGLRPDRLDIDDTVSPAVVTALLRRCDPVHLALASYDPGPGLSALSSLTRLTSLRLETHNSPWSPDVLPTSAPLASLTLDTWPDGGFGALAHLGALTDLNLWQSLIIREDEWRQLAALPFLSSLSVAEEDLEELPEDLVLPGITGLRLALSAPSSLVTVVRAFPSLCTLSLSGHSVDLLDVSVLADLERLTALWSDTVLTGADRLAPDVRVEIARE
ncbi:NACHT domain-containing protein [Streptomyces sp. NPDC094049]|uniref:NACHT domain-containing protein n=1 Tax=Streptomyces sp. NPDC094049 TaxID=3154987 RepID=UPI0033286B4A